MIMALVISDPSGARATENPLDGATQVGWGDALNCEYDTVLAIAELGAPVDWAMVKSALKPGAAATIVCDENDSQNNGAGLTAMISGFRNVDASPVQPDGSVRITASKPEYAAGAKAAIAVQPSSSDAWGAAADDGDEIDEDDLLTAEEKAAKPELPACGPKSKGRKACKNCSCGFDKQLEDEKKGELKAGDEPLYKSACGSCYKGDAFRCADCPYRGMAAFQPGEKVELNMEDDL